MKHKAGYVKVKMLKDISQEVALEPMLLPLHGGKKIAICMLKTQTLCGC